MAVNDADDDFGLCSSDESDVIALSMDVAQPLTPGFKRKLTGATDDGPAPKRLAQLQSVEAPANPSASKTSTYPSKSPLAVKVLNEHFAHSQFRLQQEAVVARLLAGGSAVVVFPTGGGKSLCYQAPAVAFSEVDKAEGTRGSELGGITIVVSPLIALMKDQVDALRKHKVHAVSMDSSNTREQFLQTSQDIREGRVKLLYCAPERLNNEGFISSMKSVPGGVRLVAVDEAHCISEWGHSFRPDYLKVARFVSEIKAERVVCLTATATPKVAEDICNAFGVDSSGLFRTVMYRPNLRLQFEYTETIRDKHPKMYKFLQANRGPTLIYITTQKQSEDLAADLRAEGFSARFFHAGMKTDAKIKLQDEFMERDDLIVVATIAFGMGIDKPNIRNIIHFDSPSSVEAYSQQIGRAGRDGLPSNCVFYLCPADWHQRDVFIFGDLPSKESISLLMKEIFCPENIALNIGDSFEISQYSQSREFDIRPTTLSILYAILELQFGLIRATTPKYTSYSFEPTTNFQHIISSDKSLAAATINQFTHKAKKLYHIDVDAASKSSGVTRSELVAKLSQWNESGTIDLRTKGLQHVYRICQQLPSTAKDREDIVEKLYAQMEVREQQEFTRAQEVERLATSSSCISQKLAEYFGDNSIGLTGCGHCTWCETQTTITMKPRSPLLTTLDTLRDVLDACPIRDDPRFLARLAFGISSPRITELKFGNHPVFGSLCDHNFKDLLRKFTAVCKDANSSQQTNQLSHGQMGTANGVTSRANLGATSRGSRTGSSSSGSRGRGSASVRRNSSGRF